MLTCFDCAKEIGQGYCWIDDEKYAKCVVTGDYNRGYKECCRLFKRYMNLKNKTKYICNGECSDCGYKSEHLKDGDKNEGENF